MSVQSVTAKVLKIMSPDFMQIFVMCAVCAQKVMVVLLIILDFLWRQKQFLAHLWGAYAITLALSVVRRESSVVCRLCPP